MTHQHLSIPFPPEIEYVFWLLIISSTEKILIWKPQQNLQFPIGTFDNELFEPEPPAAITKVMLEAQAHKATINMDQ